MRQRLPLLLCFIFSLCSQAETLRFATDSWCPYICDPQSPRPGILVEATSEILLSTRYQPEYIRINWAQSIKQVRCGQLDALMGTYISDAPDFIFGNTAFMQSQMCFFVPQTDTWQYRNLLDLDNRRIAIMNGYSYGVLMDSYILNNENSGEQNIMRVSGDEDLKRRLTLLNRGRINTIIEDKRVFSYFVSQSGLGSQFNTAGCLKPEAVHIGFSPNLESSLQRAAILEEGIKQLEKNGRLEQIIQSYLTVHQAF